MKFNALAFAQNANGPRPRVVLRSADEPARYAPLFRLTIMLTAGIALVVSTVVLAGWHLDDSLLKSFLPGTFEMPTITAMTFFVMAISLLLTLREGSRVNRVATAACAGFVMLIALLSTAQYIFEVDLRIDRFFVAEGTGAPGTIYSGWMAPISGISFLLLSASILLTGTSSLRIRRLSSAFAPVTFLIALLALLGYHYDAGGLTAFAHFNPMAFPTALNFAFLSVGVMAMRGEPGILGLLFLDGAAGAMSRRLIPAAILVPALAGWLCLIGEERGLYGAEFGVSLFALTNIVVFLLIVWWTGNLLHREDHRSAVAEEALHQEREFLSVLLENLQDGIMACDASGRLTMSNRKMREFHQMAGEIHHEATRALPPEEWASNYGLYLAGGETPMQVADVPLFRAFEGETIRGVEMVIKPPDGLPRTVVASGQPLHGEHGEKLGAVVAMHDITERIEASRAIEELMRRNELILESAADGILGLDCDGLATFANRAVVEMTGWTLADLQHQSVHDLLHPRRADNLPCRMSDCPVWKTFYDGEIHASAKEIFRKKNGEAFPLELTSAPIYDGDSIAGSVITLRDLTQRRRLESQLEQANRLASLGRVAAKIAHDVNGVLMGIQPFVDVIRRKASGDDLLIRSADQIANSVKRGKGITTQILRYTQRSEAHIEHVSLTDSLRQILGEAQALAGESIRFQLSFPPEPVTVLWDPSQMQQVMSNLIANACDAMPAGGTISIDIRRPAAGERFAFGEIQNPEAYVQITVRDTGTGISAAVLHNVFEPLFTTKRTNTGLGLALARQIVVERHRGHMFVESEPGEGAAFHLFIPMETSSARSLPAQKVVLAEV